jgi:inhibitor of cysteine peptidase
VNKIQKVLAGSLIILAALAAGCSSTTASTTTTPANTAPTFPPSSTTTSATIIKTIPPTTSTVSTPPTIAVSNTPTTGNAYTDPAQTVTAAVNEEITFALKSNPTTGYSWGTDFDKAMFSLVSDTYSADPTGGQPMVGSGGTQYIKLKALKAGDTTVTFNYRRAWETATPASKQTVFKVTIK